MANYINLIAQVLVFLFIVGIFAIPIIYFLWRRHMKRIIKNIPDKLKDELLLKNKLKNELLKGGKEKNDIEEIKKELSRKWSDTFRGTKTNSGERFPTDNAGNNISIEGHRDFSLLPPEHIEGDRKIPKRKHRQDWKDFD